MTNVKLLSYTPEYMSLLKQAAEQCYQEYATDATIEHIISSGHLSVLEHCTATFQVRYSRKSLGQDTRHRHKSFTVQSTRGSEWDGRWFTPKSILTNPYALEVYTRLHWEVRETYEELLELGIPVEDASYVLTLATETSLVVSANFRSWFEWLPKRLCSRAQEEIRTVAQEIQRELAESVPEIFNRNFMNCDRCTEVRCSFKGGN